MAQNWIIDRGMLLMDEPFSALDVHTRQRMETELLTLWEATADASREDSSARSSAETRPWSSSRTISRKRSRWPTKSSCSPPGPASRIVARHPVTLDRPRDLIELRTSAAFIDLYRSTVGRASRRSDQEPARDGAVTRGSVAARWQVAVGAIAVLPLWQTLVTLEVLDPFFVSRPSDIAQRIVDVGGRAARCGGIWRRRSKNRCSA